MKKNSVLFILLFLSIAIYSQESGIKVITSDTPNSPATARAVGARGEVDVMAALDQEGNVISAEAFSGHPLLRRVSMESALKWKFEKISSPEISRSVVIAFYFGEGGQTKVIEKSEKASEEVGNVTSTSFSRVELRIDLLVPRLLLLPREKGVIKAKTCELHNEVMAVEILSITRVDNDTDEYDFDENYFDAMRELFPNANEKYYGNQLDRETERAEAHFCKACRLKQEQWISEHRISN